MKYDDTLTAQEYIVWCVQTLSTLNDGPEYDELNETFVRIIEQLEHLEACLRLDPYDPK